MPKDDNANRRDEPVNNPANRKEGAGAGAFEPVSIPPKMDPVSTPAAAVNPALTSPAEPKYEIPKGTRAGSRPHLAPDATFAIVHPCNRTCQVGQTGVKRESFRPLAALDNDTLERHTNDTIERLMRLGAIVHEPAAE